MGRHIITTMEILKKSLPGVLILCALGFGTNSNANADNIGGAVMPHHLLVKNEIENLYKKISTDNNYERIIVISPNHFGYGYYPIQTSKSINNKLDGMIDYDSPAIEILIEQKAVYDGGHLLENEHGITSHIPFISVHFPKATFIPITIKPDTPREQMDKLIDNLAKLDLSHTLIIASVDFSHVIDEETALQHDTLTIKWFGANHNNSSNNDILNEIKALAAINNGNPDSIALDSPETIYVLHRLMRIKNSPQFHLYKRTSSASLLKIDDPAENTSHIFGTFLHPSNLPR